MDQTLRSQPDDLLSLVTYGAADSGDKLVNYRTQKL